MAGITAKIRVFKEFKHHGRIINDNFFRLKFLIAYGRKLDKLLISLIEGFIINAHISDSGKDSHFPGFANFSLKHALLDSRNRLVAAGDLDAILTFVIDSIRIADDNAIGLPRLGQNMGNRNKKQDNGKKKRPPIGSVFERPSTCYIARKRLPAAQVHV